MGPKGIPGQKGDTGVHMVLIAHLATINSLISS